MVTPKPFLWFDSNAEEAAAFYLSIFPQSRKLSELRSPGSMGEQYPAGKLIVVELELNDQRVTLLNGGPSQKLSQAVSFVLTCETQQEIDHWWSTFLDSGGVEGRCGWLVDKFGLSWQIVPARLGEWVSTPKGMQAMMQMSKLDIPSLEAASQS